MKTDTVKVGDVLRTTQIRLPAMLVVKQHLENDDIYLAELVW